MINDYFEDLILHTPNPVCSYSVRSLSERSVLEYQTTRKLFWHQFVFISDWNQPSVKQKVGEKVNSTLQLPQFLPNWGSLSSRFGPCSFSIMPTIKQKIYLTPFFVSFSRTELYCIHVLKTFHPWSNQSSPTLLKWSPITSQILDHCSLMRPML